MRIPKKMRTIPPRQGKPYKHREGKGIWAKNADTDRSGRYG